ncbi:MAG: hypothetical protein ACRERR_01835 [Moraxellaceae bacterium]
MARLLSPEKEAEYEELHGFLRFYLVELKGVSGAEYDQGTIDIAEKFGRSKALVGLRQAINDIFEELSDANSEVIALLDQTLSAKGLVLFSELHRRYSNQYKRLIKRGAIRNDTEFYLASGIVCDLTASISSEERAKLQFMMEAYERTV